MICGLFGFLEKVSIDNMLKFCKYSEWGVLYENPPSSPKKKKKKEKKRKEKKRKGKENRLLKD